MKLSVVVTSRNDNYGGNMKERATLCLSHMINTFDEVVYVDYNSPGKTLFDEIKHLLPVKGNLKVVVVSPEDHKKILGKETPGMVEVFARNIGIRRATGDIIFMSNIDIIPPHRNLLNLFINDFYEKDSFYTISRRDVKLTKDFDLNKYVFDESIRNSLFLNRDRTQPKGPFNGDPWSKIRCCGDFQFANKLIWEKIRGFEESMVDRGWADTHVQMKAELGGYPIRAIYDLPVFHILHDYKKGNKINNTDIFKSKDTTNPDTWGFSNYNFKQVMI